MPKSTTQFVRMMAVLMLAMSLLGMQAFAQSTTDGAIGGTVTDQTGAVIPNATVKATNIGTNKSAIGTTDGSGRFRVISLQPGSYALEIAAGSFAPYKAQGLIVEVGRVTTVEVKMSVSASAEAVDVTGEAPTVNTQSQDFSSNINQTDINELPINGRRWSQYALGTPGATPDGAFGLVSFRGISGLLNNNTVDGGDNNNAFYGERRYEATDLEGHQPGRDPGVPGQHLELLRRIRSRRRRGRQRRDQERHQQVTRQRILVCAR